MRQLPIVDFTAVSDGDDLYHETTVVNLVDHPPVAHSQP
jgi:hypothetical protein